MAAMTDAAIDTTSRRRLWPRVIIAGLVMVLLALATVGLVIADKRHFGTLVGWAFLPVITSGVIVGGVVMLIGTLALPARATWRGIVLIIWSLIAATSPLFGFLFLLPWGILAVTLPLVVWIIAGMLRPASAR
jgi:hypothetical protein